MPLPRPVAGREERRAKIRAILARVPKRAYPTMAELDAENFDDEGNCR